VNNTSFIECALILLVAGVIVGSGIFLLLVLRKFRESKHWPSTTGTIIHSSVESGFTNVGGGGALVVRPNVTYEYEVAGQKFTSSRLAIIEINTANEESAREKADKYAPGQRVQVYYDPHKPSFAVLERC
jgi:hypothetical protein